MRIVLAPCVTGVITENATEIKCNTYVQTTKLKQKILHSLNLPIFSMALVVRCLQSKLVQKKLITMCNMITLYTN